MSVKVNKFTAFFLAVFTVLSSLTFVLPEQTRVSAAENVTAIGDEAELRAALIGKGGNYSLSADIDLTVSEYEEFRYTVTNDVTLDLNGHSVTIKNTANLADNTNDSTLIKVDDGATLTISDSSANESGKLSYMGGIHLYSESEDYVDFKVVTGRNLIYISEGGSFVLNGGSLVAGNTEKEWLHRAAGLVNKQFEYFTDFAENTVCGTVITAAGVSKLTINGGTLEANGRKRQNMLPNLKGWEEEMPASVCIRAAANSNVVVNDGNFIGSHGADVFELDANSKTAIKAGKFETTPSVNERVADYLDFAAVNVSTYYGKLNLPTVFIPENSRGSLYQNNAPLEKTADAVEGYPVYLIPSTGASAKITSSFSSSNYTPSSKGTLSSGYTPYFTSDSTITYSWYAITSRGKIIPIHKATESKLDLSKLSKMGLSLSAGTKYSFECVISESYKGYTLTTVSRAINLNTVNKQILAAVSLSPSKIHENGLYYTGKAPTFSVPSNANYQIDSVTWYEKNSVTETEPHLPLNDNSSYFVVFELSAKSKYAFTADTRISFLPGTTSATIVPSADGESATVSAWISTACSHSETEYVVNKHSHYNVCTLCGTVLSSEKHTYTEWEEDETSVSIVPMTRQCSVCSHEENSAVFAPAENEKTPIYEIKVDFGTPTVSSTPSVPTLFSTPDSDKVIIDSYTWKTESGEDFETFEAGKKYSLTVVFKLNDPESNVFSDSSIASSVHYSASSISLSEDNTVLTVTYTVSASVIEEKEIVLPILETGEQISNADIGINGNATVHWYKDGKKIGYCDFSNGTETDHDYDPDDDVDFLTHTIQKDSIYYVRINWHVAEGNLADETSVSFRNDDMVTPSVVGGEFGFASAYYVLESSDKYIRTINISGITEPTAGSKPKTTGATIDPSCTISSIVFTSGGTAVSKFTCDKQYTVEVTITVNDGYTLALVSAAINGHHATVTELASEIILTYTFKMIEHNIDVRNATVTLPTCSADGSITSKCKNCSVTSDEITIDKTGHSLIKISGIASTCKNDGVITHYTCNYCQKIYADNNAEQEITKDATLIPKVTDNHIGESLTVHNGNSHYNVCLECLVTISEEIDHKYGDAMTDAEGNKYYSCSCGHSVPASGPKQPEFVIGGVEEEVNSPTNGKISLGGFDFDTIKTLLIIMMVFALLLIGSIVAISVILIVTHDYSGKQLLPVDEKDKKETATTELK